MAMAARWSADHLRLHRQLRRDPALLPSGAPVLVAISGGQDSMAMLGLLLDLRRLHHWPLLLWHGNHQWRPEAGEQARQLAAWAAAQGLPIRIDAWAEPAQGEAAARRWRYGALARAARELGTSHVATGHTASDRAETLLLNLARGSHRRGLASLRLRRALGSSGLGELQLVRPLLDFSRADTARICRELALPIWPDPSNQSPRFSRNRIRREVLPVLEQLHPGAERRISALAERLAAEEDGLQELLGLALQPVLAPGWDDESAATAPTLHRPALLACSPAVQRALLQHWLRGQTGRPLPSRQLDGLLARIAGSGGPAEVHLGGGWRLRWQDSRLSLYQHPAHRCDEPAAGPRT